MFDNEKMVAQQVRASEDKALSRFDQSAESRKASADRPDTQIREAKMEAEEGQQTPLPSHSPGPNTPLDASKVESRKASTELERTRLSGHSVKTSARRESMCEAILRLLLRRSCAA
jgi:hypothetical protein